jgi:hypothetical protein
LEGSKSVVHAESRSGSSSSSSSSRNDVSSHDCTTALNRQRTTTTTDKLHIVAAFAFVTGGVSPFRWRTTTQAAPKQEQCWQVNHSTTKAHGIVRQERRIARTALGAGAGVTTDDGDKKGKRRLSTRRLL